MRSVNLCICQLIIHIATNVLIANSVCFYSCCYARGADDYSAEYIGYIIRKRRDEALSAAFRKNHLAYVNDEVLRKQHTDRAVTSG